MSELDPRDVRIDGVRFGNFQRWERATHFPTGIVLDNLECRTSDEALAALEAAVREHKATQPEPQTVRADL
jgi:hypothetical protein